MVEIDYLFKILKIQTKISKTKEFTNWWKIY